MWINVTRDNGTRDRWAGAKLSPTQYKCTVCVCCVQEHMRHGADGPRAPGHCRLSKGELLMSPGRLCVPVHHLSAYPGGQAQSPLRPHPLHWHGGGAAPGRRPRTAPPLTVSGPRRASAKPDLEGLVLDMNVPALCPGQLFTHVRMGWQFGSSG
jgi:hypothetical protein